jgi:putative acetyltransferase
VISLRTAGTEDYSAIRAVLLSAFETPVEAELVEALRAEGCVILELVAENDEGVAGHILYSELPIEAATRTVRGASLAPMAVHPAHQRLGIGGALIHMSLAMLAHEGVEAVVVVGHPDYYPRFGFSASLAVQLETPFPGPHLMAMELEPGSIEGLAARPRFARAFGL